MNSPSIDTSNSIMRPMAPLSTTTSLSARLAAISLAVADHLGVEQDAVLRGELAVEQVVHAGQHVAARDVGHEAEPPLVDADQRHAIAARRRAALSMVPSPPSTMARSAWAPMSLKPQVTQRDRSTWRRRAPPSPSMQHRHAALVQEFRQRRSDSAISRLWYLPIRAMVLDER